MLYNISQITENLEVKLHIYPQIKRNSFNNVSYERTKAENVIIFVKQILLWNLLKESFGP